MKYVIVYTDRDGQHQMTDRGKILTFDTQQQAKEEADKLNAYGLFAYTVVPATQ